MNPTTLNPCYDILGDGIQQTGSTNVISNTFVGLDWRMTRFETEPSLKSKLRNDPGSCSRTLRF